MKLAFFDFDGTITKRDTFIEFAKFSLGRGRLFAAILKNSHYLAMWKLGIVSNSKAKQRLFSSLYKGKGYEWLKGCGIRFGKVIDRNLNRDVADKLRQHIKDGHKVAIVSASIPEWIYPWASENGVEIVIGTQIEVNEDGMITGKFLTDNCYGQEKVNRIREMFPDIDDYETWGYGDSSGDSHMLEMVNHSIRIK